MEGKKKNPKQPTQILLYNLAEILYQSTGGAGGRNTKKTRKPVLNICTAYKTSYSGTPIAFPTEWQDRSRYSMILLQIQAWSRGKHICPALENVSIYRLIFS